MKARKITYVTNEKDLLDKSFRLTSVVQNEDFDIVHVSVEFEGKEYVLRQNLEPKQTMTSEVRKQFSILESRIDKLEKEQVTAEFDGIYTSLRYLDEDTFRSVYLNN